MKTYMVVATFRDGVTADQIRELIPEEQKQAKLLEEKGLLGFIKVAMAKRKVFIEAFGDDEKIVSSSIESLPLVKLWSYEIYETTPPAGPNF
jgi:hypothetical protein